MNENLNYSCPGKHLNLNCICTFPCSSLYNLSFGNDFLKQTYFKKFNQSIIGLISKFSFAGSINQTNSDRSTFANGQATCRSKVDGKSVSACFAFTPEQLNYLFLCEGIEAFDNFHTSAMTA